MEDMDLIEKAEAAFPQGTTVRFVGYCDEIGEENGKFKGGDILTVIGVCDENWPGGIIVRKYNSQSNSDMVWMEEIELV